MVNFKKYLNVKSFKNFLLIILFSLFFISSSYHLQAQQTDEYLVKSVFILKIPLFIDWPENSSYQNKQNDFVIGIIGDDPFNGKLQSIIKSRNIKIKNKDILVKNISRIENIDGVDMLFISNSEKYNIVKIIKYIENKPILTLSDTKAFVDKGVMINTYIEGNSLKFDVNMEQSNKSKIYISSKLLSNANIVIK